MIRHSSAIFPSAMRLKTIPSMCTFRPVAGTPKNSPACVASAAQWRATHSSSAAICTNWKTMSGKASLPCSSTRLPSSIVVAGMPGKLP
ncbi:hypothetical protein ATK30_6001 [Amycolatopsis echigonensis]|uniref:Uncharacterized protein n=1 Tax=Amycolatopsis echigonensis TaxID=2576905 RepID=A0A2N3WMJ8_9PSEU|nr:hypothetical protein ATK30_6001 [Amycolatopsis niigatensis]